MSLWLRMLALWRNLTHKQQVENDLDDELRSYRQMIEDEKRNSGVDPMLARRESLLELGGAEQIKEQVRDIRFGRTLENTWTEVRQSVRGLTRSAGVSATGVIMLALGIGAAAVVFSVFYAALIQPLPFRQPERVVELSETRLSRGLDQVMFTEGNFWDVRSQNRAFEEVAAYHSDEANLWAGQGGRDAEVVGVVGDMRERGLASNPTLAVYFPFGKHSLANEFVVHTAGNSLAVAPAIRAIAADLDADLPLSDVGTFDDLISRSVSSQRFNTILLGVFSGLALLLATTGIYGVLSYAMSRRTSEIGLRVAMGASARSIMVMSIGQGMRPALAGIVLGGAGALWLSRHLTSLLFGVKPFDGLTYAAVVMLLLATALLACLLPAQRAMRIDPMAALRIE